mmetsp:Transcript_14567/g.43789  ORF Transcript_14567/g.43789 Transcript_14567/m.43789 type:complete len:92 (-) Transcript_14567:521-796(-)
MKVAQLLLGLGLVAAAFAGKIDDKECEVCMSVLDEVEKTIEQGGARKKTKQLSALEAYCAQNEIGQKQKKIVRVAYDPSHTQPHCSLKRFA